MLISELIVGLEELKKEHGDLEVIRYSYAGGFDLNQDTLAYNANLNVVSFKGKDYVEIGREDINFRIPDNYVDEEDVEKSIQDFIEYTYFGKRDTLQFVERYFYCKNNDERERVVNDMLVFYKKEDFSSEIYDLFMTVDEAMECGTTYDEIKPLFGYVE